MSEQQQQQAPKRKLSLYVLITFLRFYPQLIRSLNDPKAFEQIVEKLTQESGVPPKDIPSAHNVFIALKDAGQDKRDYPVVDRYLVGGMGVVDLILLQVLLSAGTLDTSQSIALFLLVLSLPLTAMSLFFSFLKQQYKITTYGRVHSLLSFFALVVGTCSLDAAIWHVSRVDGIVFLCLAVVMYSWAASYLYLIHAAQRFIALQKPPEAEEKEREA